MTASATPQGDSFCEPRENRKWIDYPWTERDAQTALPRTSRCARSRFSLVHVGISVDGVNLNTFLQEVVAIH